MGLRHLVTKRVASFNVTLTLFACVDIFQTGHAYSLVEKHNAKVTVRNVWGSVPYLLLTSVLLNFFLHLLWFLSFHYVFCTLDFDLSGLQDFSEPLIYFYFHSG